MDQYTKSISNLEWDSYLNCPHFKKNHNYYKQNLDIKSFLLIEVKSINMGKQDKVEFNNVGWTCI